MSAAVITPPDDEPVRNELAELQVRRTANYIATDPNLYPDPALTLGEVSSR